MHKYLPAGLSKRLSLEQALARSGFLFVIDNGSFDFKLETEDNRRFLNELLRHLGIGALEGSHLSLPSVTINQVRWIDAWQTLSGGAEGGPSGVQKMDLQMMDSYLAGVSRWLSGLGYPTSNSCDGHGRRLPQLNLVDSLQAGLVSEIVDRCSSGKIAYAYPLFCPKVWQSRDEFYCQLLNLAEHLYSEILRTKSLQLLTQI